MKTTNTSRPSSPSSPSSPEEILSATQEGSIRVGTHVVHLSVRSTNKQDGQEPKLRVALLGK
mgnify:FL=1